MTLAKRNRGRSEKRDGAYRHSGARDSFHKIKPGEVTGWFKIWGIIGNGRQDTARPQE